MEVAEVVMGVAWNVETGLETVVGSEVGLVRETVDVGFADVTELVGDVVEAEVDRVVVMSNIGA